MSAGFRAGPTRSGGAYTLFPLQTTQKVEVFAAPDRLDSWKEIAAYLRRSERTVRRWERKEGLPVHRQQHDQRGSVYAYARELDGWRESRRQLLGAAAPGSHARPKRWIWISVIAALSVPAIAAVWFLNRPEPTANASHPEAVFLVNRASGLGTNPGRPQIEGAIRTLREAIRIDPMIHLGFGRTDAALDWLEKAVDERHVGFYLPTVGPFYDALRDHPRFRRILQRINVTL